MVYTRGKGKIYYYRFRFGGRIIHESTKTRSKTVAREAERIRRRELEEKWNHIEKRTLPPTFYKAAEEWRKSRLQRISSHTAGTDSRALKHLLPRFGHRLLCDITAREIETFQANRQREGAQGRTINMEVGVLRQVLISYRVGQGKSNLWTLISQDVHMLPERRDIGRALTADEERRLLEETAKIDSACHTASLLALNTAMSKNEVRTLRWNQVNFEERKLVVGKSKNYARTGRIIPLNPPAFAALVDWARGFPSVKAEHYVFPRCESRHIDPTQPTKGWRTAWRNALKKSGVQCRFHDLRHTCITKLAEGKASEQTNMAIAGHLSRKMLEHYSHIRMEAKRAALDAIATPVFEGSVHQIDNQVREGEIGKCGKLLN